MEGQGEGTRRQVPENISERRQNYLISERASLDLSGILTAVMEDDQIAKESRLKASVYSKKEIQSETTGLGMDEVLKLAKEKGWRVAIYNPGVAWTGNQWADREVRDNPFFRAPSIKEILKRFISREEATEEEAKSAALDFLAEGDFDLAVTFDPLTEKGQVSSLRADMLARRETIKKVGERLGEGKLEIVSWSNGAFKEFQIHRAAFEVIATELPDKMGVFKTTEEAREYVGLHGKYRVDLLLGGAPADRTELATPFKLTSEIPLIKTVNVSGLKAINWLIGVAGETPSKYIPETLRRMGTKVLEMGRGLRVSDIEAGNLDDLQKKMKGLFGEARILALADTSGSVVDSSRQYVGDDLRVIYGDKAIMIETHDNKPLPKIQGVATTLSYEQSLAQHGELKRYGVLAVMRRTVDEIRKGTFDKIKNEQERFVVVDPEAQIYEQKKGTRLRLNPLPKLGS